DRHEAALVDRGGNVPGVDARDVQLAVAQRADLVLGIFEYDELDRLAGLGRQVRSELLEPFAQPLPFRLAGADVREVKRRRIDELRRVGGRIGNQVAVGVLKIVSQLQRSEERRVGKEWSAVRG